MNDEKQVSNIYKSCILKKKKKFIQQGVPTCYPHNRNNHNSHRTLILLFYKPIQTETKHAGGGEPMNKTLSGVCLRKSPKLSLIKF